MAEALPSILLVDDDAVFRGRLAQALEGRGMDVWTAAGPEEALARAREETPEYAVVDLRMPGGSGLDLVQALHALDATTRIVVLTGYGSIATALSAVRLGATHYLTKPADVDEILAAFQAPELAEAPADAGETPSLARVEWEHIQRVLGDCNGNLSEAARRLGMHRRSLQRKAARRRPLR
ncbi:MAG TPA: response regulator transcription factor [Holophagaceae bacterium]